MCSSDLVAGVLATYKPEDGVWSSGRFCRAVGEELDRLDQGPGILRSAYRAGVPVFIPAFTDSEMGLDFSTWAMSAALRAKGLLDSGKALDPDEVFAAIPPYNPFLDLQEYARFIGRAETLVIFTIGGGVPRNWAHRVAPSYDITAHRPGNRLVASRDELDALITPVHPAGPSALDPAVIAWVETVAATAPPLTPADAAQVAALLVGRGGAAA